MSDNPSRSYRLQIPARGWLFIGLLGVCLVLLSAGGDEIRAALRYDRTAVLDGQYWRLLTGHLVHGGWQHLFLNLAGLALLATLFAGDYDAREWLLVAIVSVVSIAIGFLWLEPRLGWYVGLSGVLHGVLAAGMISWWRMERPGLALALTAVVVGKLLWEQLHGALPLSGGMAVIVDAHLYGAVGGALAGAAIMARRRG